MPLKSKVSPPAKCFTQLASENSVHRKKKKKDVLEKLQIQQLKSALKVIFLNKCVSWVKKSLKLKILFYCS